MMFLKRIGSVGACLVLLAAMLSLGTFSAAADTQIRNTLDFSAMPQQDNTADSVRIIKEAGAFDAVNLYVAGNHTPVANPGGYMGEGYYIQKLDAGAGSTLRDVYLDLVYWVSTADRQGYLKVYASTDNLHYSEIFSQTEGNGDPWIGTTMQEATIPVALEEETQVVYVKVVMQHWTTWEGAAVKISTLRGTAENGSADVPPPTQPVDIPHVKIESAFDFSAMATDVVKEEVRQDLKSYGLYDCQNVQIGGNFGNVATPGGYAGEGYVIHKLTAPEGHTFLGAQLDLRYWAYHVSQSEPGYLVISASVDGQNFVELLEIEGSADKSSAQTCILELPMAAGAREIYVKVTMQHWESYEGAAVKKMTIIGRLPEGAVPDVEPTEPTEPEATPTEPTAPAQPTEPEATPTEPTAPAQPTEPEATPTEPTAPAQPTEPKEDPRSQAGGWILPVVLGAAALLAAGGVAWILKFRKKKA